MKSPYSQPMEIYIPTIDTETPVSKKPYIPKPLPEIGDGKTIPCEGYMLMSTSPFMTRVMRTVKTLREMKIPHTLSVGRFDWDGTFDTFKVSTDNKFYELMMLVRESSFDVQWVYATIEVMDSGSIVSTHTWANPEHFLTTDGNDIVCSPKEIEPYIHKDDRLLWVLKTIKSPNFDSIY